MQHGIYYAYWEHEWKGEYEYYVEKVARLGFDILEIAAGPLPGYTDEQLKNLRKCAEDHGIRLTVGYGPHRRTASVRRTRLLKSMRWRFIRIFSEGWKS